MAYSKRLRLQGYSWGQRVSMIWKIYQLADGIWETEEITWLLVSWEYIWGLRSRERDCELWRSTAPYFKIESWNLEVSTIKSFTNRQLLKNGYLSKKSSVCMLRNLSSSVSALGRNCIMWTTSLSVPWPSWIKSQSAPFKQVPADQNRHGIGTVSLFGGSPWRNLQSSPYGHFPSAFQISQTWPFLLDSAWVDSHILQRGASVVDWLRNWSLLCTGYSDVDH